MNIVPFNFESHEVRTVVIDNEVYFVAKDVATALGYANPSKAVGDHCKGVTKRYPLHTAGGMQELRVIAESDVMRLIVSSKLPAAEAFERLVFEDILPTIRKTGSYGTQLALTEEEIVQQALAITTRKVAALEAKVEEDAPKVEYVDKYVSMDSDITKVAMVAAGFGMTEPALRAILQEERFAYRKFMGKKWSDTKKRMVEEWEWMPYKDHLDHFDSRPQHNAPRLHNGQLQRTLYVTPSGVLAIEAMLNRRFATIEEEQN